MSYHNDVISYIDEPVPAWLQTSRTAHMPPPERLAESSPAPRLGPTLLWLAGVALLSLWLVATSSGRAPDVAPVLVSVVQAN